MKAHILTVMLCFAAIIYPAETLKAQMFAQRIEGDYVLSYKLNQIKQYISSSEPVLKGKELHERLVKEGFYIKEDSILVSFKIHHIGETENIRLMNLHGATFHQVLEGDIYYSGFVQIDSLLRFPFLFPGTTIRAELEYRISTHDIQGPERINSATYETGSVDPNAGAGVIIGILDKDWSAYNFAMNDGLVPAVFTYYNCESGTCAETTMPGGNSDCSIGNFCAGHGTMTAQTVFHHAPAATYIIYNTEGGNTARAAAIQHAANQGVNIITCSQSSYNTGWNDNTGIICSAANASGANNVLMFFSAGNRNGTGLIGENGSHWQGEMFFNIDNFLIWGANDIVNNRTTGVPNFGSFHVHIQCDNDGGGSTNRYEIQIINTADDAVLQPEPFSQAVTIEWPNNTGGTVNVGVRVKALTATRPHIEMWTHDAGLYQYFSTSNQTSSPANCTNNPRIIPVAAVHQSNYDQPNPDAMWYSSRGPTNNNYPSVGIAGPTRTSVSLYNSEGGQTTGTYGGTSAATPNVAGAAAAFWSKHPTLTADQVKDILLLKAQNYKDWGDPGYDNTFGHGGAFLFSYYPNNIYLDQDSGESGVAPSNGVYPWHSLKDIHNLAPENSNVIMLTNDSDASPFVISKNMIINAAGNRFTNKVVE